MERDEGEYIGRQRLELVLEAAGLDLWENDLLTGAVTRKAVKIFAELGYTSQEAASYIDDLFLLVHPDDSARVRSALADHLAGITPHYRCEFRVLSKAGLWIWYANHGKIMGDQSGVRGHRLIGVTFNIDEARRAGFRLVAQHDFVKPDGMDYFLIFRVTD